MSIAFSGFNCPVCGEVLNFHRESDDEVLIFCSSRSCKSIDAYEGGLGTTEELAFHDLCGKVKGNKWPVPGMDFNC